MDAPTIKSKGDEVYFIKNYYFKIQYELSVIKSEVFENMKYILSSLIIGLTLLIVSNYGWDQCDICGNVSGVACISESSFQVCSNNAPYGNVLNCPPGTFCSNTAAICSMDVPACSYCGVCSDDLRFACISSTTFALCLGTTEPNQQFLASCKENEVCQRTTQSPNFCIPDENVWD